MSRPCHHITATLQCPRRWIANEEGSVFLTLHNHSSAPVVIHSVRLEWPAKLSVADERLLLRADQSSTLLLRVIPSKVNRASMIVAFEIECGGSLRETLRSKPVKMEVRSRESQPEAPGGAGTPRQGTDAPQTMSSETGTSGRRLFAPIATDNARIIHRSQNDEFHLAGSDNSGSSGRSLSAPMATDNARIIYAGVYVDGTTVDDWLAEDSLGKIPEQTALEISYAECSDTEILSIPLKGIRPGSFPQWMDNQHGDAPVRETQISKAIWFGRNLVSQEDYFDVMDCLPEMDPAILNPLNPVVNVTWGDAVAFCRELTIQAGADHVLPPGYEFRLPTEAEWEYVCRAGDRQERMPRGGCSVESIEQLQKVAFSPFARRLKTENRWSVRNLLGYVHQWCQDFSRDDLPLTTIDPLADRSQRGKEDHRIARGGCFGNPVTDSHATFRLTEDRNARSSRIGFRVVLAPIDA